MNAGKRVHIKRYPHLTGTVKLGSHHVTYRNEMNEEHTPPEPRVYIAWDAEHGTPETTTIMEALVEVIE